MLGNGTVNVARFTYSLKDAKLELVDESSHFSVGKRMVVPIEKLNDPAVGKSIKNKVNAIVVSRASPAEARKDDDESVVIGRDAQNTGVGSCGQVNCPTTVGSCGKVNCPS